MNGDGGYRRAFMRISLGLHPNMRMLTQFSAYGLIWQLIAVHGQPPESPS